MVTLNPMTYGAKARQLGMDSGIIHAQITRRGGISKTQQLKLEAIKKAHDQLVNQVDGLAQEADRTERHLGTQLTHPEMVTANFMLGHAEGFSMALTRDKVKLGNLGYYFGGVIGGEVKWNLLE